MPQFEKIDINQALIDEEKTAIDALGSLKTEDLIKALKDNDIMISGQPKKLTDIAEIFNDCISVDKDGKFVRNEEDKNKEPRLDDMIKNWPDLAYFISVVAKTLKIAWAEKLAEREINAETRIQLKAIKELIEKPNTPTPAPEVTTTLQEADITFKLYSSLKASDVIAAVVNLQKINPELAKKVIPLLKSGDIVGVQKALGMEEWNVALYKKADGKFGKNTLNNLKNGKIIVTNNSWNKRSGDKDDKPNGNNKPNRNNETTAGNDQTIEMDGDLEIERVQSLDTLPVNQTPEATPTKEYRMDISLDGKIWGSVITAIFYPDGVMKLITPNNIKNFTGSWKKSFDGSITISKQRFNISFKNHADFVAIYNKMLNNKKEEKDKGKTSLMKKIFGVAGIATSPLTLPVLGITAAVTAPVIAGPAMANAMYRHYTNNDQGKEETKTDEGTNT